MSTPGTLRRKYTMAIDVGKRISRARLQRQLTQREVAERMGKSAKEVSHWETGVKIPSANSLVLLANVLVCTVDFLLGRQRSLGSREITVVENVTAEPEPLVDHQKELTNEPWKKRLDKFAE